MCLCSSNNMDSNSSSMANNQESLASRTRTQCPPLVRLCHCTNLVSSHICRSNSPLSNTPDKSSWGSNTTKANSILCSNSRLVNHSLDKSKRASRPVNNLTQCRLESHLLHINNSSYPHLLR